MAYLCLALIAGTVVLVLTRVLAEPAASGYLTLAHLPHAGQIVPTWEVHQLSIELGLWSFTGLLGLAIRGAPRPRRSLR